MADSKVADLTADTSPSASDLLYKVDSTGSNGSDRKVALNKVGGLGVIAETALGANAASVTFASIPSTYRHLCLVVAVTSAVAAVDDDIALRCNSDSAANYSTQRSAVANTTESFAASVTATYLLNGASIPGSTAPASSNGSIVIWIPDYAGSRHKHAQWECTLNTDAAVTGLTWRSGWSQWRSTSAITQLVFTLASGSNFTSGSVFTLYGMRGG